MTPSSRADTFRPLLLASPSTQPQKFLLNSRLLLLTPMLIWTRSLHGQSTGKLWKSNSVSSQSSPALTTWVISTFHLVKMTGNLTSLDLAS